VATKNCEKPENDEKPKKNKNKNKIEIIFVLVNYNTKIMDLIKGERYLFQATGNRTFAAEYVNRLNKTTLVTKYSDKESRMCGGVYSYPTDEIIDAFPLSSLVPGHKYRFWYLESKNDENLPINTNEYYRKSREGIFVELTDPKETLRYDTRENPEHLRMGIVSCPLYTIIQIDKL